MAVVIPLIAVAGGISAGMAIAAGAAVTFGSALAIAGGMASGLGLLTGDKDFKRLGSALALAGGIANAVQGAAGALGGAGEAADASSAWSATADGSVDAAESATFARQAGGGPPGELPTSGAQMGTDYGAINAAGAPGQPAQVAAPSAAQGAKEIGQTLTAGTQAPSAQAFQTAPTAQLGADPASYTAGRDAALAEAAAGMTKDDIVATLQRGSEKAMSLLGQAWDGAGKTLNAAGEWVKKNPGAANAAFGAIDGAFGQKAQEFDFKKSLIERARQNQNSPIRLQFQTNRTVGG
jgi:hypothetical protein